MKNQKEILTKAIISISGTAFFILIASARIFALIGCIIAGCLIFLFTIKEPFIKIEKYLQNPRHYLTSSAVSIVLGAHFFTTWQPSGKLRSLAALTGVDSNCLLFLCAVICVVAAMPFLTVIVACFADMEFQNTAEKKTVNFLQKASYSNKSVKKVFFIICMIYMIGICAILRANYNYIDDMGRVARGYRAWDNFSRILSNILSVFVHAGSYLTDISPLPQMIAIVILAGSGVLMLCIIYDRRQFSVWEMAALILLGLNPYFLQCLSYKYDAPYMALSVMGSIMPLYFRRKKLYTYVCASIVGSLVVCTTYQAATGIFPMLVIVLALRMWNQKEKIEEIGRFCVRSLMSYGAGLILFRAIIMMPVNDYVSSSLPDLKNLAPCFLKNLIKYYTLVKGDFKTVWLLLIFACAIGYVWSIVHKSKQKKYMSFVMALLSVVLMLFCCFGVYPVLETPLFQPRAMYGFGVFVSVMGIMAAEGKGGMPFKLSALMLSWMFFAFAFTYGNSLYVQKEYTNFRMQEVIDDLDDMGILLAGDPVTVQISGTIGQSPVLRNMPQDYEMLNRLVPITFNGTNYWGTYEFYHYYDLANIIEDDSVDLKVHDLPVLKETMYHTIKGEGQQILVELKEGMSVE